MKKIISYILLIAALTAAWAFGAQSIQFPESFALRGALPSLEEWRGERQISTAPQQFAAKLVVEF